LCITYILVYSKDNFVDISIGGLQMLSYKKYLYLVGTLGCGLLLLYTRNFDFSGVPLAKYAIFLLLMLFSEIQTVIINDNDCCMEYCFVYSSIHIFGPVPAALMKALSTLFSQIYFIIKNADSEAEKLIFHVGQTCSVIFLPWRCIFILRAIILGSILYIE